MSFSISDSEYKRLLEIAGGGHSGKKNNNDAMMSYYEPPQEPKQQGFFGDTVDAFQKGMYQGVSDLARGVSALTGSQWFSDIADGAAKEADAQVETMSDEMQEALNQNVFDGWGKGALNARWWAAGIGQVLGANIDAALTMGVGKIATSGVKIAGKGAARYWSKEAAEKVGEQAIHQAAKRGIPKQYWNTVGYTATMSAMTAGSRANQVRNEIFDIDEHELVKNTDFGDELLALKNSPEWQGKDYDTLFDEAKIRFADKAARSAAINPYAVVTDLATNALSGFGGGFMGAGKAASTIKGGLLKGAVIEGSTEAVQGAMEQYAINDTAREYYDSDRSLTDGMEDNIINSAVLGAGFGAPMGAVDAMSNRRTIEKKKKVLLNHVSTGNEALDVALQQYVDSTNKAANDLSDLVSIGRINALNAMGRKEARSIEVMQPDVTADTQQESVNNVNVDPIQSFTENHQPTDFSNLEQPVTENNTSTPNISRVYTGDERGNPFASEADAANSQTFIDAERNGLMPKVVNNFGNFIIEMDDANTPRMSQSAMKSVEANIKRGQEAMTKAIVEKSSVHRAMYNYDLNGWVDFEYGDDGLTKPFNKKNEPIGKGISHIIEARMRKDGLSYQDTTRMLTENIVDTIAKGKVAGHWVRNDGKSESVQLDFNGYRAGLIRNKGSNGWLLTAFELYPTDVNSAGGVDTEKTTLIKPTLTRQDKGAVGYENPVERNVGDDTFTPTQTLPIRSQQDMGARYADNITNLADKIKFSRSAMKSVEANLEAGIIAPKDDGSTHYIADRSNQIKSATDNVGSYPRTTHATSILKSLSPTSETLSGDGISIVDNPRPRNIDNARYSFTGENIKIKGQGSFQQVNLVTENNAVLDQDVVRRNISESLSLDPETTKRVNDVLNHVLTPKQRENIDVIQSGQAPNGMKRLITPDIEGWFDPRSNKVTLVADGIHATQTMTKEQRVAWVTWHELAHRGVNVRLKGEYAAIMQKADTHSVVNAIATKIQQDRKGTGDLSEHNRNIAVEEAITEVLAAHESGNFDELRQRYDVKINRLHETNFKTWFNIIAEKVRSLIGKLFGVEQTKKFSNRDLLGLITEIKKGIDGGVKSDSNIRYSLNESVDSAFAKAVDSVVNGRITQQQIIDVGTTPNVLKMLGLPDTNVTISGSVLRKVMLGKHNVTSEALKQLPQQINNPVAIMKSSTQENGYVVLTELTENVDEVHKPVVAALHLKQTQQGLELINIASVYGRNNSQIQRGLENDLLYWNKEKGAKFLDNLTLQLRSPSSENSSNKGQQFLRTHPLKLRWDLTSDADLLNRNIKTETDLNQQIPEIKFSRAATALDSAINSLGGGDKEGGFTKTVEAFKQGKERSVSEWKTLFENVGRKWNTKIFDALAPIKYQEDAAGIKDFSQSGYVAARLAAGSASISEASMVYGLPEWKDGIIQRKKGTGKSDALLGILESLGSDANNFLYWIAGNRAEKLLMEGRENNLDIAEIAALKALNKGKEQQFETARKKLMKWNESLLDLAEEAGLFTKEERAQWEDKEWYIPFYREAEDGDAVTPFRKKGLDGQDSGIRKLKGSDKATSDLLGNIITNANKLIDASVKNNALSKTVANLADTEVISVIEKPNKIHYQQLGKAGKGSDMAMVKIKGQDYMIKIHDRDLFLAITGIDQQPLNYPGRAIFTSAKRVLTATVTSMPDFIVRNFLRDMVQAATTDRNSMRLGIDSLKGLKESYQKGGGAVDLMFSGSSFGSGYIDAGDPKLAAEKIRTHLRRKGMKASEIESFMGTVAFSKDKLLQAFEKYQSLNSAVENANRIAVYEAAIRNGKSKAQAALEAKDLMDFSMKGNSALIRYGADVLPFFNARLQGLSQLGRALKDNPKKVALRGATIALFSAGLAAMNAGNERYEELPDEEKDNYWHFFLGDQHIRVPKPFELGVMFGTIPERMVRTMAGQDSTGLFADRVLSSVVNTFALNPFPQAVKPVYELYMNKNMFTGREIESMADRRLLPEARYDYNTSLTARGIGRVTGAVGVSPKQVEHLVRGYFGTLGMYVLGMTDTAIRATGDYGYKPEKNWNELPVLGALFGGDVNVPRRYTSYMNDYYEFLNKANEVAATVKSYEDDGNIRDAQKLALDNRRLLNFRERLSPIQKELRGVRNELDLIQNSRTFTAEQKRQRIDRLLAKRNSLIQMVVGRMRQEDF